MLIYFGCLLVVTLATYLAQKSGQGLGVSRFFVLVAFSSMVLVPGMREYSVGTDTKEYIRGYELNLRTIADVWNAPTNEPGYSILSSIAHFISDDYWALLTTIAIIVVFCHMLSIYRFSVNPAIAFFVFITMGYYTFFFNGARQGMACAIYSLSFGALINGNFKKYALWVLLAALFHKSVILALPLYFLFRQKISLKYVLQMVVITTGSIIFFESFLNLGTLISDKYAIYQDIKASGGKILTLFYVLLSVVFVHFRSSVSDSDRKSYDCFLSLLIFGSTVYVVVTFAGGYVELTRIANYFQIASIFLWPILFRNIHDHSTRQLLNVSFVIGSLVYFYIFLDKMADLVPYQFNNTLIQISLL